MDDKKNLEYQKNLYLRLSWICLGHVEPKRKGNAKKAAKMLSKIVEDGVDADISSLHDFLHSDRFDPGYGATAKQALQELSSSQYFRSHNVEYDFDLEGSLRHALKDSWLHGFDTYIYLYQQSCRKLENIGMSQEVGESEVSHSEDTYHSHTRSYSRQEDNHRSHAGSLDLEKDDIQELNGSISDILDEMFKRWQQHSSDVKLSSSDYHFFEKYFGGFSFDYENIIKNGVRMNSLFNSFFQYASSKKNPFHKEENPPSITQLLELADIISKEVPKELLREHSSHGEAAVIESQILGRIDIHHALEKYQEAYEIYKKHYESLSLGDKEFEMHLYKNSIRYHDDLHLKDDQFEIISPEKLTSIVNDRVADKMISNYSKYQTASVQAISSITKATKYMSPEKVAGVYDSIRRERSKYAFDSISSKDETRDLQYNFAEAIAARVSHKAVSPKEERKLLNNVCSEYFGEELNEEITEEFLEDTLQVFAQDGVLSTNPARVTGESEIFGIHKLQRTFAKVNGSYHRLESLRDMEIKTRNDQKAVSMELEHMLSNSQGGNESGKRL